MSNRYIAHLAHVEVLTPGPDDSLQSFKVVFGLEESGRVGQSVYLPGWGDHSLQLAESKEPGIGHIGWRAWSPGHLEAAIAKVHAAGAADGGPGRHGMGEQDYLYAREPGGVRIEVKETVNPWSAASVR